MTKGDVLCLSVRLKSVRLISEKAYKITDLNGNEDIIPASQVFGIDTDDIANDAWWISKWILKKKNIVYSDRKSKWFKSDERRATPKITRRQRHDVTIIKHTPEDIEPVEHNEIESLAR